MATGVSAGGFAEFRPDYALVCPGLLLPLLRVTPPEPPPRIPGPYHTGWARGPRRGRSSRLATGACVYLWKALTGRRNCVRNNRHKSTDLLAGSFRVLGKDKHLRGFSFLALLTSWCWGEGGNKLIGPRRLSGKSWWAYRKANARGA